MQKNIFLFLSIIISSGLLLTNIYTSVVDATSWGSNIPVSIEAARKYFSVVNPGTFFRIFSPVNQLLALVSLILFWRSGAPVRSYLGIAFAFYLITEAFTFGYFYPRNAIMFGTSTDVELIKQAWSEWNMMNWLRSALLGVGVCFSCLGLNSAYQTIAK
jgi:Domain of unknown function (DUF1772)